MVLGHIRLFYFAAIMIKFATAFKLLGMLEIRGLRTVSFVRGTGKHRPLLHLLRQYSRSSAPHEPLIMTGKKNVIDTYNSAVKWFESRGLDDAEDSARHLISHAAGLGYRFSDFTNNSQKSMSGEELNELTRMCQRRANREPVQYIIGNWDFYGLTFQCKPPILIPRPETEELVENILQTRLLQNIVSPHVLDVGAGTGAIGIAIMSQLPAASCWSVDINADAVELALTNARNILGESASRYKSHHCDFRSFVKTYVSISSEVLGENSTKTTLPLFDLIVSNPPYIPSADLAQLQPEIKEFEDAVALDGGADGLDIVRDLMYLSPLLMNPAGSRELWLEVSESHPAMIRTWLNSTFVADKKVFYEAWLSGGGPVLGPEWEERQPPELVSEIVDLVGNPRFVRLKF